MKTLEWVCNTIVFLSAVIIASGRPVLGFAVMLLGNILFVVFGVKTEQYSFSFYNVLFGLNAIYGLIHWSGQ